MKRTIALLALGLMTTSLACSREEARSSVEEAARSAQETASATMEEAQDTAAGLADSAREVAANVAADAVGTCRSLAERGAWDEALEVCRRAHELLPDDLALEHAYQQAQAAAAE